MKKDLSDSEYSDLEEMGDGTPLERMCGRVCQALGVLRDAHDAGEAIGVPLTTQIQLSNQLIDVRNRLFRLAMKAKTKTQKVRD